MSQGESPGWRAELNRRRSTFVGSFLFAVMIVVGIVVVDGFWSMPNLRSMLLFGSFLGIASLGQTLCALVGGLDLSIPFVIGAANVSLLWLIGRGVPSTLAIIGLLAMGGAIGIVNGLICFRQQGQALIVTLGTGTALLGGIQIMTSVTKGAYRSGGEVIGNTPDWLRQAASFSGTTLGIPVAPAVFLWLFLSIVTIVLLRRARMGRSIYAVGGNRIAAKRSLISEQGVWVLVFGCSGVTAALTGILLLGFSGSGYSAVGDPYLFTTLTAVVIGGTTLVGGRGGYGLTVLGVGILTVLTTVLVGLGLSDQAQETILGLLIIPIVAFYARGPHPRMLV